MKYHKQCKQLLFIFFLCLFVLPFSGCADGNNDSDAQPTYQINSPVVTTLEKTVIPVEPPTEYPIMPNDVADFASHGYGVWAYQTGIDFNKRLDLMPTDYVATAQTVTNSASLLRFFTMTDIHLTDVQSPASTLLFGLGLIPGQAATNASYSPVIPYTTQVFDAAVQTVNALHKKQPFDFGLFLGDAINLGQKNELRWYIDILDGKTIHPDSDPVVQHTADFMQPFKAAGLDSDIPWYQVIGNHDHFWSGVGTPTDKINAAVVGEDILNLGNIMLGEPLENTGFYMGVVDGFSADGKVINAGAVTDFVSAPKVNANPERTLVDRNAWVAEFFKTSSYPQGHGFYDSVSDPELTACYSFEPKGSTLPLKIIVLDDTEDEPIISPLGTAGFLNQTRFDWLINELKEGQQNGKLMIVAAHVPIKVDTAHLWAADSSPNEDDLVTELHKYSNLILWVSGHRHMNKVTAMPSKVISQPELGFWEVETASLRDFPQQFRLFDIVRNSDNTISIFATNVDPAVSEGTPAARSRSLAVSAYQIFNGAAQLPDQPTGVKNVELLKMLSPKMKTIIQNYGTPLD